MTLQDVIKVIDELPPDELHKLRVYIDRREWQLQGYETAEEAADEALWDEAFANSQDFLARLSEEIEAQYQAGLTKDFDPDTDPDLQ
jgi:hypothetical protein